MISARSQRVRNPAAEALVAPLEPMSPTRRGKRIDLRPMLTHSYSLKDIGEAYSLFGDRREGVIKVAIRA
jgi:hypothetical protein